MAAVNDVRYDLLSSGPGLVVMEAVIASGAKQSSGHQHSPTIRGSPRRFAPRDDDPVDGVDVLALAVGKLTVNTIQPRKTKCDDECSGQRPVQHQRTLH